MKTTIQTFDSGGASIKFERESGDPKFHGTKGARGEKRLFRFVCKWLNARGFDLMRIGTQKEGQMLGDQFQTMVRPRKRGDKSKPNVAFYSGFYALRGANEDWNKGEVICILVLNYFEDRPTINGRDLFKNVSDDIKVSHHA